MVSELGRDDYPAENYAAALQRIRAALEPIGKERIAIEQAQGRIAARDLVAPFQMPSRPVSTRDGFAVRATDTQGADVHRLHQLQVIGSSFPDTPQASLRPISPGEAMAISAGAALPSGADAVLAAEKATRKKERLLVDAPVRQGSGVLFPGDDVRDGTPIVDQGRPLNPSQLGVLAATGLSHIEVYRTPRVALISTGDEIAQSPKPPESGEEAAPRESSNSRRAPSNAVVLGAWCARFGLAADRWVVGDKSESLARALDEALARCDVLVTIGGTGPGVRDLVHEVLDELGWHALLEGVRLRPGRTSGFGIARDKPVFLLPGTPAANETAFLLLALPGLVGLAGVDGPPFPVVPARLCRDLRRSREQKRWTQAIRVRLSPGPFFLQAAPLVGRSIQEKQGRLVAIASTDGIVLLEEGDDGPRTGDIVGVILLTTTWS